ncbi:MAG TPA: MarP family serine protease [Candidatus Saccharimonadales bacterium]|nr:MarP family serine protease [Candidatus Saccharimonadales bacterium]
MNIIDIIIVLFFITALMRGVELGVVRQVSSTIGLLAGLFIGAFIQGKVIDWVKTPESKALLALVIIVAMIGIFSSIGELVGTIIRQRIERAKRAKILDNADRSVGAVVAGVTLLAVVWLGASIFASTPIQGLQRQIKGSVIIAQLNKSLPNAPNVVARLGHFINPNGIPNVFTGLEPSINPDTPIPSIGDLDAAVKVARESTVKIEGEGCGGISQGSGFVADNGLVITNAHVIAGVTNPKVLDANGRHNTRVIWFNPDLDIAVLSTDNLAGQPLALLTDQAASGSAAAALGYPGGGDFTAQPATIVDAFKAVGRNIYNQGTTERQVYSLKSDIEPGNSGGPLVNKDGAVIGVIFAKSTTYDKVGYALTMDQVVSELNQAKDRSQTTSTGSCAE